MGTITPLEFEKDDDANFHIDFITATSNLRASNYQIPTADKIRTKMIAGKIIPAMITTTALVTGLVGFEALKYAVGVADINHYRSSFVNVALPLLALSSPMPTPVGTSYTTADGRKFAFTMWDRVEVGDGTDMTVGEVIKSIEAKYGLDVCMMSTPGGQLVYNGLCVRPDALKLSLKTKLENILKKPLEANVTSVTLILNASCGDDDVDVPAVRYRFR
jgi:ubiquitin-activating enzyme E1